MVMPGLPFIAGGHREMPAPVPKEQRGPGRVLWADISMQAVN